MRQRKWKKSFCALLLIGCMLAQGLVTSRMEVSAAAFNNAYDYYTQNGENVKFWKVSKKDGEIYYATKANVSTASIRFKTLGWKVSVRNASGKLLQIIYCKLGGSYMKSVDTRVVSGYEYNLYSMKLSSLVNRMSTTANKALQTGDCSIILDACMTVLKDGVPQGSMTDGGSFSGSVYTNYDGIVGAAGWSSTAKASLHSYFDKEVEDLFYNIKLKKSTGISAVTGGGHYLYGTQITVSATLKKGYTFNGWTGVKSSDNIDYEFYVNESGTMTANALPLLLTLVYHRNTSSSDTRLSLQSVNYGDSEPCFKGAEWENDGKKLAGWGLSQGAVEPSFALNGKITNANIIKYAPQLHLYAVWVEEGGGTPTAPDPDSDIDPEPDPEPDPDTDLDSDPDTDPEPNPDTDPELNSDSDTDPEPDPDIDPDTDPDSDPDSDSDPDTTPGSTPTSTPTSDWWEHDEDDGEPAPPSDDELPAVEPIRMRFISKKYFEDASGALVSREQGGLDASSRWAGNPSFRNLLRQILGLAE